MPLGPGVRYRVKTQGGKSIRLAFKGRRVIEAKSLETGAAHTPSAFAADRRPSSQASDRRQLRKVRKDADLTSHPMTPRDLFDNEVHSQISGMLRGVGENFT